MDLFAFVKPKNELESRPEEQTNVPFVPEEMWTKCPKCGTMLLTTDMEENFRVCTKCGHHFRMNAKQRVALLADDGSFASMTPIWQAKTFSIFQAMTKSLRKQEPQVQKNP